MIKLKQAIIVEGKYDKIKLSSIIDGLIIETDGFRIFKDTEKRDFIRKLAKTRGIIVMTDSDGGGRQIRSFLLSILPTSLVHNVYIPKIDGKEKIKRFLKNSHFELGNKITWRK